MLHNLLRSSLFLLTTLLLAACLGSTGPGQTVKRFMTDLSDGKVNDAVALVICPPGMEPKLSLGLGVIATEAKNEGGITSVEILTEEVHGDLAQVEFIAHTPKASAMFGKKDRMSLQKIDGKWRINLTGSSPF